MKVISIESPQQLKDGTVKASITVSEENYVPLIHLKIRAQKGDAIKIDDAGEEGDILPIDVLINIQSTLRTFSEQIAKLIGDISEEKEIKKEGNGTE